MYKIAGFFDDFGIYYHQDRRPIIIYGAGNGFTRCYKTVPKVDMICDKKADQIRELNGIKVHYPEHILDFNEPIYILVSIISKNVFEEVCTYLKGLDVDAIVFHAYNNVGLVNSYVLSSKEYTAVSKESFRVNLVCYEKGWILQKIAMRMERELKKIGVEVSISEDTLPDYDINHHIQFATYNPYPNDTIMVSHIDGVKSLSILRKQLEIAAMAICMSRQTMEYLCSMGLPREKLSYINPAHDSEIPIKKYVIGITHRCYDNVDVRKRTKAILDIMDVIDPRYFKFIIMGAGWDSIVSSLRERSIEVDYYPGFELERYKVILKEMDYYLFIGFDEGSMGYLDALSAGVGTIVTPQGFHLDNNCPIDYPCRTIPDFRAAFLDLQEKRMRKVKSVSNWTWDLYVKKHMDIWNYILRRKSLKELYKDQLWYEDGIFSILPVDNRV